MTFQRYYRYTNHNLSDRTNENTEPLTGVFQVEAGTANLEI